MKRETAVRGGVEVNGCMWKVGVITDVVICNCFIVHSEGVGGELRVWRGVLTDESAFRFKITTLGR